MDILLVLLATEIIKYPVGMLFTKTRNKVCIHLGRERQCGVKFLV